jgi:hypothetical protein
MRDLSAGRTHVDDPLSGSSLTFEVFDSGREGGYIYRYCYRPDVNAEGTAFRVLLSPYTSLEADARRTRLGFPELKSGIERYQYLQEFAETHGMYFSVSELDLLDEGALAKTKAPATPSSWLIDWEALSELKAREVVEILARTVFLAWSQRPGGSGFYPDHLIVNPARMPGNYVLRAQADDFMEQ